MDWANDIKYIHWKWIGILKGICNLTEMYFTMALFLQSTHFGTGFCTMCCKCCFKISGCWTPNIRTTDKRNRHLIILPHILRDMNLREGKDSKICIGSPLITSLNANRTSGRKFFMVRKVMAIWSEDNFAKVCCNSWRRMKGDLGPHKIQVLLVFFNDILNKAYFYQLQKLCSKKKKK